MRPIAASKQAMNDLRSILKARTAFYSKADITFDTSASPIKKGIDELRRLVSELAK
jgi:XRE family transcriptional regulator, aerobic/anaerobic benzoate catabolism transcriptional regulator